jgi:hypothetical protein
MQKLRGRRGRWGSHRNQFGQRRSMNGLGNWFSRRTIGIPNMALTGAAVLAGLLLIKRRR